MMDCCVCYTRFLRGVACPRCAAQACGGCARRWALEGAAARCFACSAGLAPSELARMFPGDWLADVMRDRDATRALERERARIHETVASPLFAIADWVARAVPVLAALDTPLLSDPVRDIIKTLFISEPIVSFVTSFYHYYFINSKSNILSEMDPEIRFVLDAAGEDSASDFISVHVFAKRHLAALRPLADELQALVPRAPAGAASAGAADAPGSTESESRTTPAGFFCPMAGCEGFVVGDACRVCGRRACPNCHEPLAMTDAPPRTATLDGAHACSPARLDGAHACPPATLDGAHACAPATLAALELIRTSAKPCPSCARPITRTEGCSQMYCTMCCNGFDWNTGKILDVGRYFHNPHAPRAPAPRAGPLIVTLADIVRDGRVQGMSELSRIYYEVKRPGVRSICQLVAAMDILADCENINSLHEQYERKFMDNRDIRILYALGEISSADLGVIAEKRHRLRVLFAAERDAMRGARRRAEELLARHRVTVRRDTAMLDPDTGAFAPPWTCIVHDNDTRRLVAAVAREVTAELAACAAALDRAAATAGIASARACMAPPKKLIYNAVTNAGLKEYNKLKDILFPFLRSTENEREAFETRAVASFAPRPRSLVSDRLGEIFDAYGTRRARQPRMNMSNTEYLNKNRVWDYILK